MTVTPTNGSLLVASETVPDIDFSWANAGSVNTARRKNQSIFIFANSNFIR